MSGPMVPTYQNQSGLLSEQETYQYSQICLTMDNFKSEYFPVDIRGEYTLATNCGQPLNCLFVQEKSKKEVEKRKFMFFEHQLRHGHWDDHFIVIADNIRRLEHGEHRNTMGNLAKGFRFLTAKANRAEEDQHIIDFSLESTGEKLDPLEVQKDIETSISVDGTWANFSGIALNKNYDDETIYYQLSS